MEKIKNILTNKWFKLAVSLLTGIYTALLVFFVYAVLFYDIEYTNKLQFAVVYSIFSFLMCGLMLYTRQSLFCAVFAMFNMLLLLPTLLVDFGNWPLLIPAILVTLFSFFSCKMNVTLKTVFGTIFLLMYIVGGVGYYLVMNVFRASTTDTLIASEVSPSGSFRYYTLDVKNNATGKIVVYVEPNNLDVDLKFIKLDNTIRKMIKQSNKPFTAKCEWKGDKLYINGDLYFDEAEYLSQIDGKEVYNFENSSWIYSSTFNFDYPLIDTINSVKKNIKNKFSQNDGASSDTSSDTSAEASSEITTKSE
jgi:hypothetical protein